MAFGVSINLLSLFAMVVAIGILNDDAIVIVENVERIMREEGLDPREATVKAMGQITVGDRRHHAGADRGVHADGVLSRVDAAASIGSSPSPSSVSIVVSTVAVADTWRRPSAASLLRPPAEHMRRRRARAG